MNLISFLPIISQLDKKKVRLYFVSQSFGSLMILIAGLTPLQFCKPLLVLGLTLKLGLIPLHF